MQGKGAGFGLAAILVERFMGDIEDDVKRLKAEGKDY